ncbi:hypothetical protein C8F01DRAFT_1088904 [Mycena amicta]|nr:hypothetical protein C8F01DRAFT_1088904 [Mycena amicta]
MSAPVLHKFVVYAPDKTDPDAFDRRMSVRGKHLEAVAKNVEAGIIRMGGVMLTPESITGADKKMVGSVMIIEADTIETVESLIENDLYYTAGVWDPEKLVILPFISATPFP